MLMSIGTVLVVDDGAACPRRFVKANLKPAGIERTSELVLLPVTQTTNNDSFKTHLLETETCRQKHDVWRDFSLSCRFKKTIL